MSLSVFAMLSFLQVFSGDQGPSVEDGKISFLKVSHDVHDVELFPQAVQSQHCRISIHVNFLFQPCTQAKLRMPAVFVPSIEPH